MKEESTRIAFIHPDLGIGGAERLVVDAAVGLQSLSKTVDIYTLHCDKTHCFDEVRDGTLAVHVYGDWLPTHMFKKLHIFFSILRQAYLVFVLIVSGKVKQYDYFIVDQLSFCVPLLALFSKSLCRTLFYCHFPDQLLARRDSMLKLIYRLPFDLLEAWTMGGSDKIVVNLNFTKSVFHKTFPRLKVEPGVIYPCVSPSEDVTSRTANQVLQIFKDSQYFLSINRFERKKNIELAIKAFAIFLNHEEETQDPPRLVLAGGYDLRVAENVEYLQELEQLCKQLGLASFVARDKLEQMPAETIVLFLPSIASSSKTALLKHAECLLYTPSHEHFGIVPVEGMLFNTPVLAANNGGPLESIVSYTGKNSSDATGYTVNPDPKDWATTLVDHFWHLDAGTKHKLGENGHRRALKVFSREEMSAAFWENLQSASTKSEAQYHPAMLVTVLVAALVASLSAVIIIL